jgi:RNAse (barnase) inhibitor barstar
MPPQPTNKGSAKASELINALTRIYNAETIEQARNIAAGAAHIGADDFHIWMNELTGKEGGLVAALHRIYHNSQTIEKARNIVAGALHLRSVDELQRFEIDGVRFSTLEDFFAEISEHLLLAPGFPVNLDQFNDVLNGDYGLPDEGFILVWRNHHLSRERLGYDETIRYLRAVLPELEYPSSIRHCEDSLAAARRGDGPTLYDDIIEIVQRHGPNGTHCTNIVLVLQ